MRFNLIWEKHGAEILQPLAETAERQGVDILGLPDYQLRIADLWEEAERPEKAIEALESLRCKYPRRQGVNRRLCELYIRQNRLDTAVLRIKDEATCDEAFGEDSVVRLLLWVQSGSEETRAELVVAQERYQSSPSNIAQRSAIQNVLRLAWRPFDQLSQPVQGDWVIALWWCLGEHSGEFPETERAGNAVSTCARALETHLREGIFKQLRETAKPTDVSCLPQGFRPLQGFLQSKGLIDLGVMLDAIRSASPTISGVLKTLWDLLVKRSSRPHLLRDRKFDVIRQHRNSLSHDSGSRFSIAEATECLRLCEEFFSMLEQPPQPPPEQRRKG